MNNTENDKLLTIFFIGSKHEENKTSRPVGRILSPVPRISMDNCDEMSDCDGIQCRNLRI